MSPGCRRVGEQLGIYTDTPRNWVDAGERTGLGSEERALIREPVTTAATMIIRRSTVATGQTGDPLWGARAC